MLRINITYRLSNYTKPNAKLNAVRISLQYHILRFRYVHVVCLYVFSVTVSFGYYAGKQIQHNFTTNYCTTFA